MSQLTVTTLSDGTVSVPTNTVVNGSAKAWVNFKGTGTIATRDSLNVSSLVDSGAGAYGVNLTSAMANTNFSCPMSADPTATSGGIPYNGTLRTGFSVSSISLRTTTSVALNDSEQVSAAVFGDLA